ncbi:MAG: TonB-dependent receptor, partial [Bacteroidia bacterium]|nr:carboxypeptidase-like regulatory domain-containing protein [Bacteroidia bacterium]MDW8333747.1 TonB-dependent receptor [Bacteroidia bacterium]
MRKIIFCLALLPCAATAQNIRLSGKILDAVEATPLPGATVKLASPTDSIGTFSDANGNFAFERLKTGAYRLIVLYMGYEPWDTTIVVKRNENPLVVVRMRASAVELDEVKIESSRPAVELKGDTVQYSAQSYKTAPDANAADLMQKLPGVAVEGATVKAQGEEVKRVLIDGKPFFGNDPGAALKNLPAAAVDKVQIFDRQSDRARLTGVDDGQSERAVNFVLKPEYKNGLFGRVYAGYGTDERYNAGFAANRFKDKRRLTLIGLFNNVNQRNFASEDLASLTTFSAQQGPPPGTPGGRGPGGRMFAPSSGLLVPSFSTAGGVNRTDAIGLNFADEWKKIVVFSGDYTFNRADRIAWSLTDRTFFAGGLSYRETYRETAVNPFHRYNLRVEINPDTAHALVVQSSGTFSFVRTDNSTLGLNRVGAESVGANENAVLYSYFVPNTQHSLVFRRKFAKAKRNFSLETTLRTADNVGTHRMRTANFSFLDTSTFGQTWRMTAPELSLEANATFVEPISKIASVEFSYAPQYHRRFRERVADRLDYFTNETLFRDTLLSFTLPSDATMHTGMVVIRFAPAKHNVHWGAGVQHVEMTGGQTRPLDESFRRVSFYPMAQFGWRADWSRNRKLRLFYRPSVRVPAAFRFQSALDNANPLSLSTGNVSLRPEYEHVLRGFWSLNDPEKGRTLWVHWFGNYVHDYIGSATYVAETDTFVAGQFLPRGGRFVRPENFAGYALFRPSASLGFSLSKFKSKLNVELSPQYTRTPGTFNGRRNVVQRIYTGGGATLTSSASEKWDYTLSYN